MIGNKNSWLSLKYALLIIVLSIIGFGLFIYAYISMNEYTGIGQYNELVLSWMSTHRDPTINTIMQILTTTASPMVFVAIITVGAVIWAFVKREIWRPFIMSIAVIISAATSSILKFAIQKPRPAEFDMVPPFETSFSFPSGHTLSTIVFLLVVGYLFYSRYRDNDKKFWFATWMIATISGTVIIAISRLYLGYHWLTDVVASIGLGLIIFALIISIDRYIIHRKKIKVLI